VATWSTSNIVRFASNRQTTIGVARADEPNAVAAPLCAANLPDQQARKMILLWRSQMRDRPDADATAPKRSSFSCCGHQPIRLTAVGALRIR
jgi:hypothetical protein